MTIVNYYDWAFPSGDTKIQACFPVWVSIAAAQPVWGVGTAPPITTEVVLDGDESGK